MMIVLLIGAPPGTVSKADPAGQEKESGP